MTEKLIEKKLKLGVTRKGGLCLKLLSPYFTGFPDRTCLMPPGSIRFAELKTTGEKLKPRQEVVIRTLRNMGFVVEVIDDQEKLDKFLQSL